MFSIVSGYVTLSTSLLQISTSHTAIGHLRTGGSCLGGGGGLYVKTRRKRQTSKGAMRSCGLKAGSGAALKSSSYQHGCISRTPGRRRLAFRVQAAKTDNGPSLAIVGVTGAVGQEFLRVGPYHSMLQSTAWALIPLQNISYYLLQLYCMCMKCTLRLDPNTKSISWP